MSFPRFHRERPLVPHLLVFSIALVVDLVYCGVRLAGAMDYLEVLQLACTVIFFLNWFWGAVFYLYYFRTPDAWFFLLDAAIIALLTLSAVFSRTLYLWFMFILVNFVIAFFMYRLKPTSPRFTPAVQRFASRKSRVDLAVFLLLTLGMVLDLANRLFLHLDSLWRPFCLLTTMTMTVGGTIAVFAGRLYDVSGSGRRP